MNSRSLSTLAFFGFVIVGTVCLALRYRSIGRDEAAREDSLWELTYEAHFEASVSNSQQESQLRMAMPFDTRHCQSRARRLDCPQSESAREEYATERRERQSHDGFLNAAGCNDAVRRQCEVRVAIEPPGRDGPAEFGNPHFARSVFAARTRPARGRPGHSANGASFRPPTRRPNSIACNGSSNTARISIPAVTNRGRTMPRSR